MHESNFFESKDGYPTARHLGRRLVEAVGISEDYGLDILGAVCGASLAHGLALIDFGAPVCPQWLEVDPSLPHRYCSAEELLDVLDFEAEIDPKAIAEVTEAYDRDSLPVDVSDYLAVDLFEGWGRALTSRLCDFRAHLEKSVSNAGHVMTWYEDPKPF
jgi:hypothetical protein